MTNIPDELQYTREHEWAKREGNRVTVGITDFAQEQLGDVVYLDLPEPGKEVTAGQPMGEIESTKSVSDIYAPVSGKVLEVNTACRDNPASVNQEPYGAGWMVVIEASDAGGALLSSSEYRDHLAAEGGES